MRKFRRFAVCLMFIFGIGGFPDAFKQWLEWLKIVDWNYWLNSGAWIPWIIKASIITILFLFATNPEWQIRMKDKYFPRYPDTGERIGIAFSLAWWWTGFKERRRSEKD